MTTLDTRVHELAAQVAELNETVAKLAEQVAANGQVGARIEELMLVLRDQKPTVTVSQAPAPAVQIAGPVVNLPPPSCDCVIEHHWEYGRIVRSVVTRKDA